MARDSFMVTTMLMVGKTESETEGAPTMGTTSVAIALFATSVEAETGVRELQRAGIEMETLSFVGKDSHCGESVVVGVYAEGERVRYWGTLDVFWEALWDGLSSKAFLWVAGIGPLVVGGPLVGGIVTALNGATLTEGLSVLSAGLFNIGIPQDSILQYETLLKAGKFMIVLQGTKGETEQAHLILEQAKAMECSLYHGISKSLEPGDRES